MLQDWEKNSLNGGKALRIRGPKGSYDKNKKKRFWKNRKEKKSRG